MTWRLELCFGAAILGFACGCRPAVAPNAGTRLPNIVLIFADDLGYQDVGCYWTPNDDAGYECIETPNLDRMATEGARFTSFFSAASICTPSRAALLTGSYPARVGMSFPPEHHGVLRAQTSEGLHPDEVTVAELLQAKGYATMCVGKWHLGNRLDFLPMRQGFDEHYGPAFRGRNRPVSMLRGEQQSDTVPHRDITSRYTQEALRFMRENREQPFFVYLSHGMPHIPLDARKTFRGRSARGLYGDVVTELDWSTGQILDELERLGLEEDTLVIFTSDNGPALVFGNAGGKAFPLRGGKATAYEGGFRVPFLARWPKRIPAGVECDELATTMDLYPTLCRLAEQEVPDDRVIDGKDIWDLMSGVSYAKSPHELFAYYHQAQLHAVRSGSWKLHFEASGEPGSLYDLERDLSESQDVRAQHADVVARLAALAAGMRSELGDQHTGTQGSGTRPLGYSESRSIKGINEDG